MSRRGKRRRKLRHANKKRIDAFKKDNSLPKMRVDHKVKEGSFDSTKEEPWKKLLGKKYREDGSFYYYIKKVD
jgi:hypothetical protein